MVNQTARALFSRLGVHYQEEAQIEFERQIMKLEDFQNTKLRLEFIKDDNGDIVRLKIHSRKAGKIGYLDITPNLPNDFLEVYIRENKMVYRQIRQRGTVASDIEGNEIRVDWEKEETS